jgi:hypothetical protein
MSKTNFVRVATCIFTIVGLVHLYRALQGLPFVVAGIDIPVELSLIAGICALLLAYAGYRHWK